MLGCQGWRLITEPQTLVACVFKAKYYRNNNFLEAKVGTNPSFIWMSILALQQIFK